MGRQRMGSGLADSGGRGQRAGDGAGQGGGERQPVLTDAAIQQVNEKLAEVATATYAEVTLVVKRGALRYVRSGVSEPIREGD